MSTTTGSTTTTTLGIISFVSAIISIFILGIIFAPTAIITGILAGKEGDKLGWWGFGIGCVAVVILAIFFVAS